MLFCQKCGNENQLGRVFCTKCGAKLDLSSITSDAVVESERVGWWSRHGRKLAGALVVLLLGLVVLAFVPRTGRIGAEGTRGGGRRVHNDLRALARLSGEMEATFDESDINGYFEFFKTDELENVDRVSVQVGPGYFTVREERTLFELSVLNFNLRPKITREFMCVPRGGGRVLVRRVWLGRLRLLGPLRTRATRNLHGRVAEQNDWQGLGNVTDLRARDNSIQIKARN